MNLAISTPVFSIKNMNFIGWAEASGAGNPHFSFFSKLNWASYWKRYFHQISDFHWYIVAHLFILSYFYLKSEKFFVKWKQTHLLAKYSPRITEVLNFFWTPSWSSDSKSETKTPRLQINSPREVRWSGLTGVTEFWQINIILSFAPK